MILARETYRKFGYWPKDLSEFSGKLVIHKCSICGMKKTSKKRNYSLVKTKTCHSCYMLNRRVSFEGKKFGSLTVLKNTLYIKGRVHYECVCKCGKRKFIEKGNLKHSRKYCSSGCTMFAEKCFVGYKEISLNKFNRYRYRAEKDGLIFNITIQYVYNLFIRQGRKCKLTGKPLKMKASTVNASTITASLDQIIPGKGYIKGNVQWVDKWINNMKSDHSQNEFIELCRQVAKYNRSNNV